MARNEDLILLMREPADRQLNDRLYPLVVAGDEKAREEMIHANMALVTNKVDAYLKRFPQCNHLRDDLISQGFVGLTDAVNKMKGSIVENPNPTGFMSVHIQQALGELMEQEATIRVPKRTYNERKAAGRPIPRPDKQGSASVEDILKKDGERDPRSLVDLLDELMGCCESPTEREIVKHRQEGRSDAEIAEILGLPKTTTYMLRRGIYARFLQRNQEYDGEV